MRSRRFSFVAGWAAVALLALAGFAAFGTPDRDPVGAQVIAAAASIGHDAGAYAGLGFARGVDEVTTAIPIEPVADAEESSLAASDEAESTTTTSSIPTTGWLSEVEVRTLVSLYFEPADVNQAVRIAWCESRFDPSAMDLRTGGKGLFNHLPQYWEDRAANAGFPGADVHDPEASVAAAAWEVYNGAGWDVFNCR